MKRVANINKLKSIDRFGTLRNDLVRHLNSLSKRKLPRRENYFELAQIGSNYIKLMALIMNNELQLVMFSISLLITV